MPATLFLLVFFLFPFYVVLAITFGGVDPILRQPVPAWNPLTWHTGVLSFTFSNITHSDGLYQAAFVHTFLFVGVATLLCLLVYGYVPFMILPLYATLDRIHPSLLEAGRDLGASPARTFWRVTLPLSTQGILAGLVICALPMFGDYFTQQLLANTANTRMIGNAIVDALSQPIFIARGAALILVLLALLVVPILYYLRSTNRAAAQAGR